MAVGSGLLLWHIVGTNFALIALGVCRPGARPLLQDQRGGARSYPAGDAGVACDSRSELREYRFAGDSASLRIRCAGLALETPALTSPRPGRDGAERDVSPTGRAGDRSSPARRRPPAGKTSSVA